MDAALFVRSSIAVTDVVLLQQDYVKLEKFQGHMIGCVVQLANSIVKWFHVAVVGTEQRYIPRPTAVVQFVAR